MALYDRKCNVCEHLWEISCRISEKDDLKPECPSCGSVDGDWMLNAPAVSMRGDRYKSTKAKDGPMSEVYQRISKTYPKSELAKRV